MKQLTLNQQKAKKQVADVPGSLWLLVLPELWFKGG